MSLDSLVRRTYKDGDSMIPMLLLVYVSGNSLPKIRERIVGILKTLRYEAPSSEWEESAMYELQTITNDLGSIWNVIENTRKKMENRVVTRYRAHTDWETSLQRVREDRIDVEKERERVEKDLRKFQFHWREGRDDRRKDV